MKTTWSSQQMQKHHLTTSLHVKTPNKLGIEEKFFNQRKGIYEKPRLMSYFMLKDQTLRHKDQEQEKDVSSLDFHSICTDDPGQEN